MSLRRIPLLFALVAVIAVLAAACGDDDSGDSTTAAAADFTTVADGKLTVCTDQPYKPFEFVEGGTYTGFDMELLRAVAGNLNLELAGKDKAFDGIWLAPEAGECDIVADFARVLPSRAEAALFSDPYFDANQSLLVKSADAETYTGLDTLDGKTIGVQAGTTGETYATENKPEGTTVKAFEGGDALFPALVSGSVDAIVQDFPVNLDRANKDEAFAVTGEFETGEQYGFATKQDNTALMDAVNTQLAALREDGTYDEIFNTWFPSSE